MIDVMIIAFNEEANLPHCLQALQGWTRRVFVIDSGSTDRTRQIARDLGAEVVDHPWEGYARQKNWGLQSLPLEADWTLILDADEVITPELRQRIEKITTGPAAAESHNGFFINRVTIFMGREIRHCGYFPSWNLRLFKRGAARYEDRAVHEHMVVSDPIGYIDTPMIHNDRRGLEHYVAKHNRYSTLEAHVLMGELQGRLGNEANLTPAARRRRWLKRNITAKLPGVWFRRFAYMYFFRLGFLDGMAGLRFCKFIAFYDWLVRLKLDELRRQAKEEGVKPPESAPNAAQALSIGEGELR